MTPVIRPVEVPRPVNRTLRGKEQMVGLRSEATRSRIAPTN